MVSTADKEAVTVLATLSLWPFVNIANTNKTQLDLNDLQFLLGVSLVVFLAGVVLARTVKLLWRSASTPGLTAAAGIVIAAFFNHFNFITFTQEHGFTHGDYVYLLIALVLVVAVYNAISRTALAKFLAVFSLVLVGVPLSQLFVHQLQQDDSRVFATVGSGSPISGSPERRNVYFIVTDSYPRHDQISQHLDFDNSAFLSELESYGFFIARNSLANYPLTFLSLSASLNGRYVLEENESFHSRAPYYDALRGNNDAVERFKASGYTYIHAAAHVWAGTNCVGHEDICLDTAKPPIGSQELINVIVESTPLKSLLELLQASAPEPPPMNAGYVRERVAEILGNSDEPFFLFAHTYPPHPPYEFLADCQRRKELPSDELGPWQQPLPYLDNLQCASRQLADLAELISEEDPDAIAIVMSDHGSSFTVDWSKNIRDWDETAFDERFGILLAVRVPDDCRQWLYDSLSPVNLFKLVFACLDGGEPAYLDDLSYIVTYENVTDGRPNEAVRYPYRGG